MKIQLNPVKWFGSKSGDAAASPVAAGAEVAVPAAVQVQAVSSSAKAVENVMATAAVVPATNHSGFVRFIDAIGHFFVKGAPVLEEIAVAAEPFLALTPFGPEYDLVLNAIVGVQKTATASLTTGATLTNEQKMAVVLEAVTPGLTAILASKKVTSDIPAAINQFAQNVYNLQTGPTTTVRPTAVAATA